jgi:acetoin:2,6-dichlorophenolindophenol oxidoreductase subunit alpha
MNLSKEIHVMLYSKMVRIRLCEESLVAYIIAGNIKTPCHLYSGQEAIAVGVCANLNEKDIIFGNHRSHGHFLAKGGQLKDLISEVFCKVTGCSRGYGGSMHLIDTNVGMLGSAPIVAGTIPLALGAALACKIRNDDQIAVSFFGDGATNEGVLYESLNFAAVHKLPIIFVCENNYYSTHMPIKECRPNDEIFRIAQPFDIHSSRIDGNDVLEVYKTAKEAVKKCREGNGPCFIECLTYRRRGHVGPDDNVQGTHTDIRPSDEIERWMANDPILRFENYLINNNIVSSQELYVTETDINYEIANAYKSVEKNDFPLENELMNYVFK